MANMSSPDGEFMVGSVVLPMERGTCTFRSIRGYVRPGRYRLTVEFGEKAIAAIGITLKVRDCAVGEVAASTGFCETCSGTTYNFNPSADECQPCPENGNCESRVITPDDGYWQKTPCSDQLYRCMPSYACEFEGRSEGLKNLTQDITSCELNEERRTEYSQAQCAKGHEGPLCGSCSPGYSSGLSSKCRRCLRGFFNVAFMLLSVLFLMGLTGVTVNGTLNVEKRHAKRLRRQRTLQQSTVLHSHHPSPEGQDLGENADESSLRGDSRDDECNDGVAACETLLAKWKAVEMFKIILNFIQTTVLLASLDVGWALPLLVMAEAADYVGGIASDGNRRSVMCLNLEDPFEHPTALAFAFNVGFIPVSAFILWIGFWTAKAVGYGSDRPPRFLAKRCTLSLMALWYVTLVPVLKTALSIGLCVDIDDTLNVFADNSTTKYWAVDTSIQCYQGDHAKLLFFLVLAFVCPVYCGLLIAFALFLRTPAQHLRDKNGWAYETTGFLYRSYRLGRRRYWEIVVVLRKVAIAFMVFCAHLYDSVVPMVGVALVIMFAIVAQIVARPYRKRFEDLDRFDLAALFVSQATTLVAIMLKQQDFSEDVTRRLATAACVLINLATFAVFACYNMKFLAEYLEHSMGEENGESESNHGLFAVLVRWVSCNVKRTIDTMKTRYNGLKISDQDSTDA